MTGRIRGVAVVVPVHDEEELLPRCIASVRGAVARLDAASPVSAQLAVEVVLVLDACTDGSGRLADASGFTVLRTDHRAVGSARAAGVAVALERLGIEDSSRMWTAHTDADSAVPAHWLVSQLASADQGVDLVVGTVRPDPADLTAAQWTAWRRTHRPGEANGHVHGANLGIRADRYLAAGGFDPVPEHEDNLLVRRLRDAGILEQATDDSWVLTSGRFIGRSPGGYARHLSETLVEQPGLALG